MSLLKKIAFVLGLLLGLLLLVGALLPSSYQVERSIVINRPPEEVYVLVADFEEQARWNPWIKLAKANKFSSKGTAMEEGHSWTWAGEDIGRGEMVLKKCKMGQFVETEMNFLPPVDMKAQNVWTLEPSGNGTLVRWSNVGNCSFPAMRFFTIFSEGVLGQDFDKGLTALKILAEQ
ncbi:MAG: hypothetical protein EAZ57_03905 [Cytophagales bacterium]|nr:MAG: hypothetical protein EAZ67_04920 [Cytophagales bacterium]TAF61355.1 MAG: hypothetical protein EAZ57_03905 [Cytophagales bacterium]